MPAFKGRVGAKPADFVWEYQDVDLGRVLCVRCRNNPDFSLIYNLDLEAVGGGQLPEDLYDPGAYEAGSRQPFTARLMDGVVRIDHLGCPAFWLEITL